MGFSHRSALALVCLASFGLAPQLLAPRAVAQQSTPTKPSSPAPLVLDVVVTAKNGVPVTGLQQSSFAVSLDKKPIPISSFEAIEAATTPKLSKENVEVVLLIDTVNTRFTNVAYERQEIQRYLKLNNGKLPRPVTLIILSDTGTQIMPTPTTDGNALSAFLEQAEVNLRDIGRAAGFYGATERFDLSMKALRQISAYEATRPGRKLLVWISPGWPLLSGPEVELTSKEEKGLFQELVGLSTALTRARITLTSVDPLGMADAVSFRTFYYKEFLKGVTAPSKMQIGNLALEVLAAQTGGQVINSNNDVAHEISAAVSDAEAFYVLTVDPPVADHPDQYRSIAVTITDKPGLTARTRTGYYAQP